MTDQEVKESIRAAIKEMVKGQVPVQTKMGVCKEVDWNAKTMTATIDGLDWFDVQLSINGSEADVKKPTVGTKVLIGLVENDSEVAFMLWCEAFDLWLLNGKVFGGLPNWLELEKQLEVERNRVDAIYEAIKAAQAAAGSSDGGTALLASIKTALAAIKIKADYSKVESKTIQHG